MTAETLPIKKLPPARTKLIDAAIKLIRQNGYAATSLDDLCADAGVSKGAFFYHFQSKQDLALAAIDFWSTRNLTFFGSAHYKAHADPLQRVLGYIDFRKSILEGDIYEFTCLLGTLVQEIHRSDSSLRDASARGIVGHTDDLIPDIAEAKRLYAPDAGWSPESLARYTQVVIQGALILAKATQNTEIARQSLDHLRAYIELLFMKPISKREILQ